MFSGLFDCPQCKERTFTLHTVPSPACCNPVKPGCTRRVRHALDCACIIGDEQVWDGDWV